MSEPSNIVKEMKEKYETAVKLLLEKGDLDKAERLLKEVIVADLNELAKSPDLLEYAKRIIRRAVDILYEVKHLKSECRNNVKNAIRKVIEEKSMC